MPKKLPFYWPDDPNCNKLRSRTLRVLRDRPNNSGPSPIQPICNSFKPNHFKTEKTSKVKSFEDFHGFISPETVLSRHCKNRSRVKQLLQSSKKRSKGFLQNLNLNSSWKKKYFNAMAVDFDHMYIDCGDSKISIGRDIECQHLKQLNLLHLDLIQQQTDELEAKDKIIKALREENKNLRSRLERIDRRVSLSHQKKNALSPISVQTDFPDDTPFSFPSKSESPKVFNLRSPSRTPSQKGVHEKSSQVKNNREETNDIEASAKHTLRKHSPKYANSNSSLSPVSPALRISPREKRSNKKEAASESKRNLLDEPTVPSKKNKFLESSTHERLSLSPLQDGGITDHSLRSRNKQLEDQSSNSQNSKTDVEGLSAQLETESLQKSEEKQNSLSIINNFLVESEKVKPNLKESHKIRGEGILMTEDSYYLPPLTSVDFLENSVEDSQTQVEIPKWRIKVLTSLYVMEGTENLEDEVFVKRHSKPEHDERRRKRWDLQRMREQRQYEKLRERYEVRNNMNGSSGRNNSSLWPNAELAQVIQIENYLPVCAFGQPLAQIPERF
ncbi:Male-specific lethal 1-like 1 [Armadillidium vulgare]|nr:Male-specific lethal 1-like 1 [Armadillidium vulgare]